MNLTDRTLLITGANGGLGTAFVDRALARGARRVYAATRRPQVWHDERIVPMHLDVTHSDEIADAVSATSDVDILVNNAGAVGAPSLLESDEHEIRYMFEANLFAPLALVRAFASTLARNGGGAVINIHSVLSWRARPGAYSATKTALWGVTNSLRLELAAQDTHVLGAHFGFVDTPMTAVMTNVAKSDPSDIVDRIFDALENGEYEAIADQAAADTKAALATTTITAPLN